MTSATWWKLIKRIGEVDLLLCPRYGKEMAKIAVIKDSVVISQILRYVHLWENRQCATYRLGVNREGPPLRA